MNNLLYAAILEDDEDRAWRYFHVSRRHLRDIMNPCEIPLIMFKRFYRMPQQLAIKLIDLLVPMMAEPQRCTSVPIHIRVLTALRFYAEGSYQKGIGQNFLNAMSQPTVSRCIQDTTLALNSLENEFIKFPSCVVERQNVSARFEEKIGFPGVLGAIDCTHIAIVTPREHEEAYVNYKKFHSLNVQMICDMDFNILNIRVSPGATNDRFTWVQSGIKTMLDNLRTDERIVREEGHYFLIGPWYDTKARKFRHMFGKKKYCCFYDNIQLQIKFVTEFVSI